MPISHLVWILITGNIRDPDGLSSRFDFLINLQERGLISGVVFSTWIGELEKFPSLREKFKRPNFILVESETPSIMARGSLVHQMVQLEHGLAACPDDCFVLRMRTDKCGPQDGFVDDHVVNALIGGNIFKACDYDRSIFKYKIGTLAGHTNPSLSAPIFFFWLDRWYFGHKQDLERLVSYHVLASDFESLIPEQALFLKFFQPYWNCLKYLPVAINQDFSVRKFWFERPFSEEELDELTAFLLSKKMFRMAFLTERWILSTHFFDFQSTLDIDFNCSYRGFDVVNAEEIEQVKSQRFYSPSRSEIDEIANYLLERFYLPKVRGSQCIENGLAGLRFEERKIEFLDISKRNIPG